jgi:long-chain acyl-CoA synthetase
LIPQNLGLLFRDSVKEFSKKEALLYKENGKYVSLSYGEMQKKVDAVAAAFISHGLEAGDRVAILSENRPEWAIVDIAAQSIGVATVPIYTSLSPTEIQYILNDSGATMIAVSNKSLFEKIPPIYKSVPSLKSVLVFDSELSLSQSLISIPLFVIRDFEKALLPVSRIESFAKAVSAESAASVIYTSGTTGNPKGVILTHANFIYNVMGSRNALKMSASDIHLSFLPLCHVFERMAGHYLMLYIGATIAYAESMDSVPQNLLEVRPTFILGVPRFYEKIQNRVLEAIKKGSFLKKALFFWAKELGEAQRLKKSGVKLSLKKRIADILVYKKFRARLGGRVRFCISGGAPLPKEIAEFFSDLGVMIYEGYGLTETSPVIAVNREEKYKFGSVGVALENVAIRITDDGEIATKGPCVMKAYFNKPEETAAVLIDGWFHTGDLGSLDADGFLTITGRKKEIIVTSGGKKVSPRPIEEMIESDPFILRCVLFGEGKKFLTAVIVPDEEMLTKYAKEEKISFNDYSELIKDTKVYQFFERKLEKLCCDLANFEKIKYFVLLAQDFSQSAGELTPTLKVKREVVWNRTKDQLLPFYSKENH